MKALNNKERNKAFYKVVGFFLVSFIIAMFLGFTTMNMGKLSDKKAKSDLEAIKAQLKFQEEVFAPNVGQTSEMLGKLPTAEQAGENIEVLNQDIGALLSQTKNKITDNESWESIMYQNIIQALSDLQLAYNEQLNLKGQLGDSGDASQKLQQCINEKNQLQSQLSILQASGGGGGGGSDAECQKELKDAQKKLRQCNLENRALQKEIEKFRNK